MTDVKNLGAPLQLSRDERTVYGRVEDGEIRVRCGREDGFGAEVFRLGYHHKLKDLDPELREYLARQFAVAIRDAHTLGFEQGRAFVCDALGIKTRR